MVVPDRIVQAERLVTLAPAVAGPFVFLDDDRRHIELAQPGCQRDAALTAANDHAIGLTRVAEFLGFRLAFFLPRFPIAFGAVFRAHRTVEANRLFVPLEFAHGRQQRPYPAVLQADVPKAVRNLGFELYPALYSSIRFRSVLTVGNFPVRGLGIGEPRLEHVANLFLALHCLDVPGEGHEVAPVAVRLKQIDGMFHFASGERLVERVEQLRHFSVRGLVEHVDVLPLRRCENPRSFLCSGELKPGAPTKTMSARSYTLTIRLPRFSPASNPISAFGVFSRPLITSSCTFNLPAPTQDCRSLNALSRWFMKSITMKPCMVRRLTTIRPGTPRGPVADGTPSYCEIAPQQAMRPRLFICERQASRISPPTLSK